MARTTNLRCDVCRKPCQRIVGKLLYIPGAGSFAHSNYTHHADVGECCGGEENKILRLLNFTKRQTKEQYRNRGKKVA